MNWFRRFVALRQVRAQIQQAQTRAILHAAHGKDDVDALFAACIDEHKGRRRRPLERFSTYDLIEEVRRRYEAVLVVTIEDDGDGQLFDFSFTGGHTQALGMATRARDAILSADREREKE